MAKSRKSTSRKSKSSKSESSKSRSPNTRSAGKRAAATGRPISPARRIDTQFKGLTQALEPGIDSNPADLDPTFRAKLNAALVTLQTANIPFKLVEGFRTVDRQQWLYGSGRPSVTPYGRPGKIVTNADGVTNKSKHQGAGTAGTGWQPIATRCRTEGFAYRQGTIRSRTPMQQRSRRRVWSRDSGGRS